MMREPHPLDDTEPTTVDDVYEVIVGLRADTQETNNHLNQIGTCLVWLTLIVFVAAGQALGWFAPIIGWAGKLVGH